MNKGLYGISKNRTYDTKYHILVESSSYAVTASYIDPTFISASAAASGFGSGGTTIDTGSFVKNSQTSSFVLNTQTGSMLLPYTLNSQTSSFVRNTQTSSFVTNSQTSSFVLNTQTGSFITNQQTASFVTNSQTGSMTVLTSSFATTASYISPTFISASAAASGFGSGGGGVTSITAGTGISVNQTTGNVIITNTGGSGGISQGKVVAIATGISNLF